MLSLDFSGLTSRPTTPSPQPPPIADVGTPTRRIKLPKRRSAFKIKIEDTAKNEIPPASATISGNKPGKIQSWRTEPWNSLPSSEGGISLTPGRHTIIVDGDLPLRKRRRSCEDHLHTPASEPPIPIMLHKVPSESTLHAPLSLKDARSPQKLDVEGTDDPEIALSRPRSPVSPETDLSDDDNYPFDTPPSKVHDPYELLTPLTPPSVHKARSSFLGNKSPSPTEHKLRRPVPRRFQHLETKSEVPSSGRKDHDKEAQDGGRTSDASVESLIFSKDPAKRKTASVEEGKEVREAAIKIKVDDSKQEDDKVEHGTCPDVLSKERCQKHLAKAKAENALRRLQEIHKPLSLPDLIKRLYGIVELMFCNYHFDEANTEVMSWALSQGMSSSAPKACDSPPSVTLDPPKSTPFELKEAMKVAVKPDYNFCQLSSSKGGTTYTVGITPCVPYQPRNTKDLSVKQCLAMCVIRPLSKQEEKMGFLYVYSTNGDFGSRKIGVTAQKDGIDGRLKGWRSQCKADVNLVYPKEGEPVLLKHVYRLEKLVHTELKNYRIGKCNGCCRTKKHIEWSLASDALIVAVIRRWSAWIQSEPYEKYGHGWQLKSDFMDLREVCTPCSAPSAVAPSRSRTPKVSKAVTTRSLSSPRGPDKEAKGRSKGNSPITTEQ
ncbi:hypothetical protein MMC18_004534 [Xylographa bjoerkii]|nr:hypothetical protein [Xylographa bjoerkii]